MLDHCYLCAMYKRQMQHAETLHEREQAAIAYNNHVINEHRRETAQPVVEWRDGQKWTVMA